MPHERPKELFFIGPIHPVTGEPESWLNGIPARDLSEDEIAVLEDDDLKAIEASGLYQKSKPTAAKPSDEPKGESKKEG
jgi:hypothetical protein